MCWRTRDLRWTVGYRPTAEVSSWWKSDALYTSRSILSAIKPDWDVVTSERLSESAESFHRVDSPDRILLAVMMVFQHVIGRRSQCRKLLRNKITSLKFCNTVSNWNTQKAVPLLSANFYTQGSLDTFSAPAYIPGDTIRLCFWTSSDKSAVFIIWVNSTLDLGWRKECVSTASPCRACVRLSNVKFEDNWQTI